MSAEVSSTVPDWCREAKRPGEWNPGESLLCSLRACQRHSKNNDTLAKFQKSCALLRYRFWSAVSGADILVNCRIGGRLLLLHPNGLVIHPSAQIGSNYLMFQQVTLGTNGGAEAPVLSGHVDMGAVANVLGGVLIGEHSQTGVNPLVVSDVQPYGVAMGIPASIRTNNFE